MALKQETVIMHRKDASGNTVMQFPITRGENIESAVPITAGGTGATTVANARTNLGLSTAVTGASISGRNITLTKADGTTTELTTQDTAPFTAIATAIGGASTTKPAVVITTYVSGASWYRVWSDGWLEQGGMKAADTTSITFSKPFKNTNYYFNYIGNKTSRANYEYGWVSSRSATGAVGLIVEETAYWYACGQGA